MIIDLRSVLIAINEQFGGGGSWDTTLRLTPGQSDEVREAAHRKVASLIRAASRQGLIERPGSLWRLTDAGRQWLASAVEAA